VIDWFKVGVVALFSLFSLITVQAGAVPYLPENPLVPLDALSPTAVSEDQPEQSVVPVEDQRSVSRIDSGRFEAPAEQTLVGLVGASEIEVLDSLNRQFIASLTNPELWGDSLASKVATTDLVQSVKAGRDFSPELKAAMFRSEQAAAQTGQALGLLLPSLSTRLSRGYETSMPSAVIDEASGELKDKDRHLRTDTSVTLRQPLLDFSSLLDWRRRKHLELARQENYRGSDAESYIETVKAYLSLVSSRLLADVTRDFEARLGELLDYIEKRANAGASSVSDMARVRARIQATLSSRLEQESAHATAGAEFVRLTNLIPQRVALPRVEQVGADNLPQTFELAVAAAMGSNPDVSSLVTELKAARTDQLSATTRHLPRLDAELTDTYSKGAGGDQTSSRDQRMMLVLNWTLLSGGKDYHYQKEKTARYHELQARLDNQRRLIVQALSANFDAPEITRVRLVSGYQELDSISTAAEAMSRRMLSGNQSLLDLLDVYDRYYQVRSRLISLHIFEMNTLAELVRLTQGTPSTNESAAYEQEEL